MSERDTKKPNSPDDLADVKSLIGNADAGDFELDDILAEYGVTPDDGHGAIPVTSPEQGQKSNVVAFPGVILDAPPTPQPEEGPDPLPDDDLPDDPMPPRRPAEVIPFPGDTPEAADDDDGMLTAFIKDINRRADDYADRMYEEDERIDPEEVRRLERLIPGTDKEEKPESPSKPKKVKKTAPPPPDTPPQELARAYLKGLKSTRLRLVFLFLLCLLAIVQLVVPALGYVFVAPLGDPLVQSWFAAGVMAAGTLLGVDILLDGVANACKGRIGMDTLSALGCVFTLADAVILALTGAERLPYTAAALSGLFFLMLGTYHKKCAQRLSCRTAAASSSPYRVTLDEGKWNGRDTYSKWAGDAAGFGSQIQVEDGADRIYHRFCPVVLLLCIAYSLYITLTRTEAALWCASAVFTAAAAFGAALTYGRSFHLCARRLAHSGAALAGWPGIIGSRRADRVLITDTDLFPPGYVELNGFKVLGDFPMERVVAYTATMIRDSGSGLTKLFHDYLRTLGGLMRNSERLCCYEGGGLSATIRGDQVLVGSAAFMNLMEITLPAGLNVKSAVFCAINGELAGIFALNYFLPDTVFPALDSLIRENVGPVLATRDFMLSDKLLQNRFRCRIRRMLFPEAAAREEVLAKKPPEDTPAAVLCTNTSLAGSAYAITGARALRLCTTLGLVVHLAAGILGLCEVAILGILGSMELVTPASLLLYCLLWTNPGVLLTEWTRFA